MYDDEEDLEHEGEMEATEDDEDGEDYEDPDLRDDGVLIDPDGTN